MRRLILAAVFALLPFVAQAQDVQLFDRIYLGSAPCVLRTGSGTPESAVSGSVCDTYLRTDTGDIYTKQSGSATTTGWGLVPRLNAANVFTTIQTVSSTEPILYLYESDQGSNLKRWRFDVNAGQLLLQTVDDAGSSVLSTALTADRNTSGITVGWGTTFANVTTVSHGTEPALNFLETGAAANAKYWRWDTFGTVHRLQTVNDAYTSATDVLAFARDKTATFYGSSVFSADVLPAVNYTSNLGSDQVKFLTVRAAELWIETLVAQNTMATIGGRVLVAPTNQLVADRTAQVATPAAPTVTPQGASGGTTYSYKIVAYDIDGSTLPSSAGQTTTGNAVLSVSNFNRVTWSAVTGALGYLVYGRTSGSWLLIANTAAVLTYDDTGAVTPSGAVPSANLSAAQLQVKYNNFAVNDQPYMESGGKVEWFQIKTWPILAVSTGSKTFSVGGDLTTLFTASRSLTITGSTGNDGTYLISSSSYNSGTSLTTITVTTTPPSAVADGGILDVTTTTSTYIYPATRDRDGSGSNAWYAGDALVDTGTTGNGYIDLFSTSGVLTGSGPTIIGNVRTGSAYNAISPRWAVGNLKSIYGYSSTDVYGFAAGDPSGAWAKIDATNGVRLGYNTTTSVQIDTSGNAYFGDSANRLVIEASGINVGSSGSVRGGQTAYNTGTGFWLGQVASTAKFSLGSSTKGVTWDGSALVVTAPDLTLGSASAFSSSAALKFARDTTFDASQIYGLWGQGSGSSYQDLVLQNYASRSGIGTAKSNIYISATGWNNSPNGPTTTSEVRVRSEIGDSHITLTTGDSVEAHATRSWLDSPTSVIGNDPNTYTQSNGAFVGANNPESVGIAGDSSLANLNFYLIGVTQRKATIQAALAGTNGGSLAIFTKTDGAADVSVKCIVTVGLVCGSPTGGDKGLGTINATAVYDDNVLLTDWVFEEAYGTAPNSHRLYTIAETKTTTEQQKRLPWMPTAAEFANARHVGGMLTRIWQGQEQQQLYIFELEQRLRALEAKVNGGRQ